MVFVICCNEHGAESILNNTEYATISRLDKNADLSINQLAKLTMKI